MAKQTLEEYLKLGIRKVEKSAMVLAYRTQAIREHDASFDWDQDLVKSIKIVDDGTGHRVAMNSANDLNAARNLEYPMPGQPAKPAITTFHYGLGKR
jgi:hypothetical protein